MAENEKMEKVESTRSDTPAKKDKKPEKKSKPGFVSRIKQGVKETKAELKKVQWPTWKQTMNNTLIVIAFCAVVCLCIFLFDTIAHGLLNALMSLTH